MNEMEDDLLHIHTSSVWHNVEVGEGQRGALVGIVRHQQPGFIVYRIACC